MAVTDEKFECGFDSADGAGIETAVIRLSKDGKAVKIRRGVYRFGPHDQADESLAPGASHSSEDNSA